MRKTKTAWFILSLILPWFPLLAQEKLEELERAYETAITQTDLNFTSKAIAEHLEEELKSIEVDISTVLIGSNKQRFEDASAEWRKFRDEQTEFESGLFEGGSIQPTIANITFKNLTESRIEYLKVFREHYLNEN